MLERIPVRKSKCVGFFGSVRLDFCLGRLPEIREVFRKKLHLLPKPPAHDEIVAIKAHGKSLAVVDFFANVLVNEPAKLLVARRPVSRALPRQDEPLDVSHLDDDGMVA